MDLFFFVHMCVCMCAGFLNFIDELPEDLISESDLSLEPGPLANSTVTLNSSDNSLSNSLMNSSNSSSNGGGGGSKNSSNSGMQQVLQSQQQPQRNTSVTPQPMRPPSVSTASSSTMNTLGGSSVPSLQPPASISTSGDPTPAMSTVSSTPPTHNVASSTGLSQVTSMNSVHHNQQMKHAHPNVRMGNSQSYVSGGPPHIMTTTGPRMSPHMQQHPRMVGPMRVTNMHSGQHGMMMPQPPTHMQHHPGMMSVGHHHAGMDHSMAMGGGHRYIGHHHPHHHAVGPPGGNPGAHLGSHPGMHSMMGGPGGRGMHHQAPMGPPGVATAQAQGMMNMGPSNPNIAMGQAPPPSHLRPGGMSMGMHAAGPRPQGNAAMATGKSVCV